MTGRFDPFMKKFDRIFRDYYPPLLVYCRKFIDSHADAGDIVQNLFARVWEQKKFHLEEKHLKAYLYTAARNACLNYLKHAQVIRKYESEAAAALKEIEINQFQSGEQSLIEKEELARIYAVLEALSDQQKEIIRLSRFDGMKNQEIAGQLGIPVRTVETRLFRALKKLREELTKKDFRVLFLFFAKK